MKEGIFIMNIPKDSVMLLSFVNTQLRDFYNDLEDLCQSMDIDKSYLIDKLKQIDYSYDHTTNQFI